MKTWAGPARGPAAFEPWELDVQEPKQFYRKLDRILGDIHAGEPDREEFAGVLSKIVEAFGDELKIANGRVYTETAAGFSLEVDLGSNDPEVHGLVLERSYPPIQLVLDKGVVLLDNSSPGQLPEVEARLGGMESAALLIDGDPRRILAFGLTPGWERVHLHFALRTIRNALHQRLRARHLELDFAQAAEIQRSLLPKQLPVLEGFDFAARSQAATDMGGDLYDFLPEGEESVYFALGDVSGHGLPAALLARDVVTGLRMGTDRELKITAIVHQLNQVIARSALSTRFVALFFAELESNGNLLYVNAGHLAPWVIGRRGTRRLDIGSLILGPVPDTRFKRGFDHLDRGDVLVAVSDGLVERTAADGSELGSIGVERIVRPLIGRPASEIVDALFAAARGYAEDRPWEDDATAVVVCRSANEA